MTTNEIATTDTTDTQHEDRPIEDLLKLDTYQGMTDTEIAKVIQWHAMVAAKNAQANATAQALHEQTQVMIDHYAAEREQAEQALKKLLGEK